MPLTTHTTTLAECTESGVGTSSTKDPQSPNSPPFGTGLDHEQIREKVTSLFRTIDIDNSGEIDFHELEQMLVGLGLSPSITDVHEIMEELDQDGNNAIDFQEFAKHMLWTGGESKLQKLIKGDILTAIASGREPPFSWRGSPINPAHIFRAGFGMDKQHQEALKKLFAAADTDKDGYLCQGELVPVVKTVAPNLSNDDVKHVVSRIFSKASADAGISKEFLNVTDLIDSLACVKCQSQRDRIQQYLMESE